MLKYIVCPCAPVSWHPRYEASLKRGAPPWEASHLHSQEASYIRWPANQQRPFAITGYIGQPPLKVIYNAISLDIGQKTNTESILSLLNRHINVLDLVILRFSILCNTELANTGVGPHPSLRHNLSQLESQYWALLGLPLLCLFV